MYDVDRIVNYTFEGGRGLYLTKWLGYDDIENTWEPINHLPKNVILQFHRAWKMYAPDLQEGSRPLPPEWWERAVSRKAKTSTKLN